MRAVRQNAEGQGALSRGVRLFSPYDEGVRQHRNAQHEPELHINDDNSVSRHSKL